MSTAALSTVRAFAVCLRRTALSVARCAHIPCCILTLALFAPLIFISPVPAHASTTTTIRIPAGSEAPSAGGRATILKAFGQPAPLAPFTSEEGEEGIAVSRIELMIGAMIMMGFRGLELEAGNPFLEAIREGKVGHVILFNRDVTTKTERNISSPDQVRRLTATLQAAAPGPLLVAVDQEGGKVRRLRPEQGFLDLPSAKTLGRGDSQSTRVLAVRLGYELTDLGISVDLAPTVDVDTFPDNPAIGKLERSFGTDAASVARHGLAFGSGLWEAGVIPTLKHFPGQGGAEADSHLALPDISAHWASQIDLKPYVEAFQNDWPGMVLVGHMYHKNLDPDRPATLSPKIINGLLRTTLGWNGVVISDDLQMKALTDHYTLDDIIFMAVEAGNDILLFGNNLSWDPELPQKVYAALNRMVQSGRIPKARIEQSWQRIAHLHATHKAMLHMLAQEQRPGKH